MKLFELLGSIVIDNKEANEGIDDTTKKAEDSSSKIGKAFSTMGKGIVGGAKIAGKAILGIGAAAATGVTAFLATAESTREYREELSKLTNMAKQVGTSSDYIKDKWISMSAVLGDEGAVTEGLNNIMAAGFTTQESIDGITEILEGAALKWKDTLKFEGLADGLQETLATGAATGPFAEMLERSGIVLDDFNAGLETCSTEAEKQDYIMQTLADTGLAKVSESYRNANGDIISAEEAQMNLTDTIAKFGEIAEPIVTTVKESFTKLLEKLIPVVQEFAEKLPGALETFKEKTQPVRDVIQSIKDKIQEFKDKNSELFNQISNISVIDILASAFNGVATAVSIVVDYLLDFSQWCIDHQELLTTIGIIVGYFAAAWGLVNGAITVWNAIGVIATAVTTGFGAAVAFLTSPITLVVLAIGALIAIVVLCIKHWDDIKEAGNEAWEGIKNAFSVAAEWFNTNVVQPVKNFFSNLWTDVKNLASDAWNGIKNTFSNVASWFGNLFSNAWNNIKSAFSNFTSFFSGLWDKIKSTFSSLGTKLGDAIGGAVKSGINTVLSMIENSINRAIALINGAIDIINKVPGVDIGHIGTLSLPRLAKGGVLYDDTAFIGGEYANAATNPEIVTPQNIMAETFDKVLTAKLSLISDLQNDRLDRILALLSDYIPQLGNQKIVLDTGALVGEIVEPMDDALGEIADAKQRNRYS